MASRMGRPLKPVDFDQLDKLCAIHCTRKEAAAFFNLHEESLDRAVKREKGMTFAAYFEEKSGAGKMSLRRKMYEMAMGGDRVMLIWLSKQYLGMSEKIEQKLDAKVEDVTVFKTTWQTKLDEPKS